jgi:hypothetical protein
MIGFELVAGYLAAYAIRKAQRAGKRADAEVDYALDSTLDRLHALVAKKLGDDPAIRKLQHEAEEGAPTQRTAQRVTLAVEDAVENDAEFEARIREVLSKLVSQERGGPVLPAVRQSAIAGQGSTVNQAGRDINQSFGRQQ